MWMRSHCRFINLSLSISGAFWMIPSLCHNDDDLYSGERDTLNAAHALNHIHDFISFGSSSASWTPPLPPGHTGSDSTPLGSRAYAGCRTNRPTGRGRAFTCFPQRYEGMTHVWRIVRQRQREIWRVRVSADKPSKNLQHLQEPGAEDIG